MPEHQDHSQYVRLGDDSLVRLDMDRGFTSVRHGLSEDEDVSLARTTGQFVAEVLDLVQPDDESNADPHPLEELAKQRGSAASALTASPCVGCRTKCC